MRNIELIVIHCSATKEDQEYTPEQLRRDHLKRGFSDVGYNFYIRRTGEVVSLRPVDKMPAHAKGYNARSIGICYEGGLDKTGKPVDTRTVQQKITLLHLLEKLLFRFPDSVICGHRDLSPDLNGDGVILPNEWIKQCPCFDAKKEYNQLTDDGRAC